MKKLIIIAVILFASVVTASGAEETEKPRSCTIVTGVVLDCVVFHMDEFYHDHYSPYKSILDSLPCETDIQFVKTCSDLLKDLDEGRVDIAAARMDCFMRARRDMKVKPLMQVGVNGKMDHRAVLLVRKDSKFKKLEDLEGARFATINSESIIFNFFPKYIVKKKTGQGLRTFFGKVIKCPSVMAALQAVILDQADVVAIDEEFLGLKEVSEKLTPIEYSFDIPYPVAFMREDASPEVLRYSESLKEQLLNIPENKKIGEVFNVLSSVVDVVDPDFPEFTKFLKDNGLYERVMQLD